MARGVRIKINELLREHQLTAYMLVKDSGGRLTHSTVYRLVHQDGRVPSIKLTALSALADGFGVELGELFARTRE